MNGRFGERVGWCLLACLLACYFFLNHLSVSSSIKLVSPYVLLVVIPTRMNEERDGFLYFLASLTCLLSSADREI